MTDAYIYFWHFFLYLLIAVMFFSSIWHYYMFSSHKAVKYLSSIDPHFTAPFFSFVLILMNIFFVYYLKKNVKKINRLSIIYFISLFYQLFGGIIFIIKQTYYPRYNRKSFKKKIKYFWSHTMFHYISYMGVSLFLMCCYLVNKSLFSISKNTFSW